MPLFHEIFAEKYSKFTLGLTKLQSKFTPKKAGHGTVFGRKDITHKSANALSLFSTELTKTEGSSKMSLATD